MRLTVKLFLFVALIASILSCKTEQEKKIVDTWRLYCVEDELIDSLDNLKADNMLTVKRKFTADNESIEILQDRRRKYFSMSPGIWKIENNKLIISMFTYTYYDAEVLDIVQIEDDRMVVAMGAKKYVWCRDREDAKENVEK